MTKAIVLLPGLEGSVLELNGEEIWPPTAAEFVGGYKRLDKLMNPAARATRVPKAILFIDIYRKILQNIDMLADRCPAKAYVFPYDWRKDVVGSAALLGAFITGIAAKDGITGVTLVGHSMGAIVSRILLEGRARPDIVRIVDGLVMIAPPTLGAPIALAAAIGHHSSGLLPKEAIMALTADPNFPGLYQMFPHRAYPRLWRKEGEPVDIYDRTVAEEYGLSWRNVGKALAMQRELNIARKPARTRYSIIASGSLDSLDRMVFNPKDPASFKSTMISGDDTVPLWSASGIASSVEHFELVTTHSSIAWGLLGGHANEVLHKSDRINTAIWATLSCTGVRAARGRHQPASEGDLPLVVVPEYPGWRL